MGGPPPAQLPTTLSLGARLPFHLGELGRAQVTSVFSHVGQWGLGRLSQGELWKREQMLTFGEFGVLDLHLQLSEENVLYRVLAQVTKEDLERRGWGWGGWGGDGGGGGEGWLPPRGSSPCSPRARGCGCWESVRKLSESPWPSCRCGVPSGTQ